MDYLKRTFLLLLFAASLVVAVAVPFFYETQTLWYKFGMDKTLLRAGQVAGMVALTLLFWQIVLAVGGPFLAEAFGLKNIMNWHRTNGVLVLFFALSHALLILIPEGLTNLPIGKQFWPEMLGSLLLWTVAAIVVASRYREKLKLDYKRWRAVHKPLGYLTVLLVVVHVLFVSESFAQGLPKVVLFLATSVLLLRALWVKVYLPYNSKKNNRL